MRRREFVGLLGCATVWPLAARGQQRESVRRIGLLLSAVPGDTEYPILVREFLSRLEELGWTEGRNLSVDVTWGGAGRDVVYKNALEMVARSPDLILAPGSAAAGPALQATRSVPVVFTIVPDPVGAGFVDNLARPGGNATGFASFDYEIGGKWLALLKEVAPGLTRVAVLRDSDITAGIGQWSAIQTAAPVMGIEASPINVRDAPDLQRAVGLFARAPNGGLIVTSGAAPVRHRDLIVRLAAEHRLPAIYYARVFVAAGGLISYGANRIEQFRNAGDYADRILKGEKPADMPVQAPTRYEMVVNLRSATAMALAVPTSVLARADEVIE
jgi:putative tryptophan/tyrosine transport system substrate-binding protein